MRKTFAMNTLAAAVLLASSSSAMAIEAASIKVGEMSFTPTLELSESYDDNFRETDDAESTWVTTISPSFVLAAQDRLNVYKLTYKLNSDTFHSSHNDNNTDHFIDADAHLEFNARNRLDLNLGYDRVEEVAGTETTGVNDKFHTTSFGGVYGFGAKSATMNIDLAASQDQLRYDNKDGVNDDLERDTTRVSATAYYRVAPKTRALVEVRHTNYDYENVDSTLNSDAMAYLVGLTWDATAKTSGTVKVGVSDKEFDDSRRKDANNSTWEVGVTWAPRTYSSFTLNTSRTSEEGSDGAIALTESFIDTTRTSLTWNHDWSSYISSDVSYSYTDEDYEGGRTFNGSTRKDETDQFSVGVNYELRRWVSVGVGYTYKDIESNDPNEALDRNIYQAKLTVGL